jgi:vacuolar-type H+-ATPase subunit E/Vma4
MPLAQLLEVLERDAREEAERLDADSRARVRAVVEQARRRAAELAEEPLRDARAAADAQAERLRARARIERAAALRAALETAVQDALDDVRSELERVREREDHHVLLRALADEARVLLPTAEVLDVDRRDVDAARAFADDWGLRLASTYSGWGGVVLADDRGRCVRNTLEERLSSVTETARAILVSSLQSEETR